ncbi:hypothetical protein C3943_02575 [Lysinibacillus sp. B2A1]|nr:hypothetical protein C3943_02575 [Lysinibacillus sp. B2A1]
MNCAGTIQNPDALFICAKAKRQQQMFSVAKAKRQLQLRQGEIDKRIVFLLLYMYVTTSIKIVLLIDSHKIIYKNSLLPFSVQLKSSFPVAAENELKYMREN